MESIPQPICISEYIWLIPCLVNRDSNQYLPLFKPFSAQIRLDHQFRNVWQDPEDETLKALVKKFGIKHWKKVCDDLNKFIYKGIAVRNSKQCRERWLNHLDPGLNKSKWTESEDMFIMERQLERGNKWSEMAREMNGRTENSVKNRWKCLVTQSKKKFPGSVCSIEELIKEKRLGKESSKNKLIKPNSEFLSRSSKADIQFSTIANKFRDVYIQSKSPPHSEISPSSLLFFNS